MKRCVSLDDLAWSDYEILLHYQDRYEKIMKIIDLIPISGKEFREFSQKLINLRAYISILQ